MYSQALLTGIAVKLAVDWNSCKTKPLEINVSIDPIKILGTCISQDSDKNNNLNFFLKFASE